MTFKQPSSLRAPRRARTRVFLAVALVPLLVAGADRLTAAWIEHKTATSIQDTLGTDDAPSVRVSGFPVLGQVLSGKLHHVDVSADGMHTSGDSPVPITHVQLGMGDVRMSGQSGSAHAESVRAAAFISYQDLSGALGIDVAEGSKPDQISASVTMPIIGKMTMSARIATSGDRAIAFRDAKVEGNLPTQATSAITGALAQPMKFQDLPRGLNLSDVSADSDGIHAALKGHDVTFTK